MPSCCVQWYFDFGLLRVSYSSVDFFFLCIFLALWSWVLYLDTFFTLFFPILVERNLTLGTTKV